MSFRDYIRLMLPYFYEYRALIALNFIVLFTAAIFETFGVGLLIPILQNLQNLDGEGFFIPHAKKLLGMFGISYTFLNLTLIFSGLILMKYILVLWQSQLSRVLSATVTCDMRIRSYDNLLKVSIEYFSGKRMGDLISTIMDSSGDVGGIFTYFITLIKGIIFTAAYVTLACILSYPLTILICALSLMAYFIVWPRFRLSEQFGQLAKERTADLHQLLHDRLGGIRVIKSFHREKDHYQEFEDRASQYKKVSIKVMNNKIVSYAFFEPFLFSILVCAILFSVEILHLPLASIAVCLLLFVQLIPQFKAINTNILQMAELLPHFAKIHEMISRKGKPYLIDGITEINNLSDGIRFENVSFTYPGNQSKVIHSLNLVIPKNQTTAIIGGSGGGKSTLMNLLLRHYDPSEGHIWVNGHDLRELRIASWKQSIGVVDQDCYLFHDTVANNIRYGKPEATEQEVRAAARTAYAEEFILHLEKGYETMVGHRGLTLSGGQRQRIALARALVKDPRILVLDEATSSLDSESERLIQKSIEELRAEKTIIVIAHRLATISGADQIIIIENGRIVEQGTHHGLLEIGGHYKKYLSLQSSLPESV